MNIVKLNQDEVLSVNGGAIMEDILAETIALHVGAYLLIGGVDIEAIKMPLACAVVAADLFIIGAVSVATYKAAKYVWKKL